MKISVLAYIAVAIMSVSTAQADDVVSIGTSKSDFLDFLSRPNVKIRPGEHSVEFQIYRFELLRGEKINGGCRYTGAVTDGEWENPELVIAMEIAHDPTTCERLFIKGIPTEDTTPDWVQPLKELPTADTGTASAQVVKNVADCQAVQSRWTDGNQAAMSTIRGIFGFQGIEVARAYARAGYRAYEESTRDQCTFSVRSYGATVNGGSDATAGGLPGLSWSLSNKTFGCSTGAGNFCLKKCTYWGGDISGEYFVMADVSARAENDSYLPGIFDCRQGARIDFQDVGVRSLNATGALAERWQVVKDVVVTGPVENCIENLYEDEAALACSPPSQ